jgi:hypothetical protein
MFSDTSIRRLTALVEERLALRRAQLDRPREAGADATLIRQSIAGLEETQRELREAARQQATASTPPRP